MMKGNRQHIYTLPGILLPLLLWVAAACTERSLEVRPEPVPIRLYTGIRTRAAVDDFNSTPVGIACGSASGHYTAVWEGTATGAEITLTPVRFYPEDGSPIFLRSYYPPVQPAQDGTLLYTLTGDEDLLLSDERSGSLDAPFTAQGGNVLMHSHLLTKLNFTIHIEGDHAPSLCVRSLQLNGLARQVTLNLQTGALTCGGETIPVNVYSATGDDRGLPIEGGVLALPGYVLVQPGSNFTLDIVLSVDDNPAHDLVYHNLAISFEGGSGESGIAYTVKVEIPSPGLPDPVPVQVTASVVSWQEGESGSGDITEPEESNN